jgi:hypothetical protein
MKRKDPFSDFCGRVGILVIAILVLAGGRLCAQAQGVKNILLVRGTFADGAETGPCILVGHSYGVAVKAFTTPISHAPWKTKPSWATLGTEDKAINPILLRRLYQRSKAKVTEIKGASHVSFISHPKEVAEVIDEAARASH